MGDQNSNIAMNSQVGNQINTVRGNVSSGVVASSGLSAADLPALLGALRHDVAEHRRRGEIAPAEAAAFEAELDEAQRHLPITDGESQSRFTIAMKRAGGLVTGLADVTAKVSEAITAVQGVVL
jgi:hypothetical protein